MSLDGTLSLNDVVFNKSDFDRIPVVVHSRQAEEKTCSSKLRAKKESVETSQTKVASERK